MPEHKKGLKETIKTAHYQSKRFYKFIPLIGIILLFILYSSQKAPTDEQIQNQSFMEKISVAWNDISSSFQFNGLIDVLITLVLLVTIWTGYKYWLLRIKYIRNNQKLLGNLVGAVMFLIFINRHIKLDSFLGKYVDWILFIIFLYIIVVGSWYIAKTIDRINLESDLYCWGLRILAAVIIFFGINFLISSTFVLAFADSKLVFNNIYWILGLCMILLGAFMGFRSARRYPMIKVW